MLDTASSSHPSGTTSERSGRTAEPGLSLMRTELETIVERAQRLGGESTISIADLRLLATGDVPRLAAEIRRLWELMGVVDEFFLGDPDAARRFFEVVRSMAAARARQGEAPGDP